MLASGLGEQLFWPGLGQLLHAGKNASIGMEKYSATW
jgi:hypothetical protein